MIITPVLVSAAPLELVRAWYEHSAITSIPDSSNSHKLHALRLAPPPLCSAATEVLSAVHKGSTALRVQVANYHILSIIVTYITTTRNPST